MYRTYITGFLVGNLVWIAALFCVRGVQVNQVAAEKAFRTGQVSRTVSCSREQEQKGEAALETFVSPRRVVEVEELQKEPSEETVTLTASAAAAVPKEPSAIAWELSDRDYEALLKIVEAEAGCEDFTGKLLVANVVLNRVEDAAFPDSVWEVVYQCEGGRAQFSPVGNGTIHRVQVSEGTKEAVQAALCGEDISEGALYFAAREAADADNMAWFDTHLTKLFAYGGHEFFG